MDETPIFRITKLNIKENDRGEYIREVENNMHNSIPAEEVRGQYGSEFSRLSVNE